MYAGVVDDASVRGSRARKSQRALQYLLSQGTTGLSVSLRLRPDWFGLGDPLAAGVSPATVE